MKSSEKLKEVELGNQEYFNILPSGIGKFDGEKKYLSTESIQGTTVSQAECVVKFNDRPSRANMQPVFNSVWFAKMQSTTKVYSFDESNKEEINNYILSTGFAGIKVNEKLVSPKYLKFLFVSKDFNELKDKFCAGSTQRSINNEFIKKISLKIPPMSTQNKIVSILGKTEKAKEWREKADKLAEDLVKSVFLEMFGDPNDSQARFNKRPFLECLEKEASNNKLKIKGKDFLEKGDYPIIDQGSEFVAGFTNNKNKVYSEKFPVVIFGDHTKIFKFVDFPFALGADGVKVLVPSEEFNSRFFYYHLCYLSILSAGYSRHYKYLKEKMILQPPLSLQNKFASIVKEVEAMKKNQNHSKIQINSLFNSLMQKAFRGEIR